MDQEFEVSKKFCIVGAGKYGSALGFVIQMQKNNQVQFLVRKLEQAEEITNSRTNRNISDLIHFNDNVTATTDTTEALKDADYILLCIPAQTLPDFLRNNKDTFDPKSVFINCSKGMVIKEQKFLNQIFVDIFDDENRYVVLSGPSFAKEIFQKHPTMVTLASNNKEVLKILQKRIYCNFFKCYAQYDVAGVELSGAVKNILALGAGYVDGIGYGYNTMAAFVTRGIKEVQLLSQHFGADPLSLFGLSGAGDIMLSCFGGLSRNRTTGYRLAKGEKLEDVIADIGTVEGIPTLKVMMKVIEGQGDNKSFMIIRSIHELIFGEMDFKNAEQYLMTNLLTHEFVGLPYHESH